MQQFIRFYFANRRRGMIPAQAAKRAQEQVMYSRYLLGFFFV